MRPNVYHGTNQPPQPKEAALAGLATSYDPIQGTGNPWNPNGWMQVPNGPADAERNREIHPHTLSYFAHQYLFRERCWNVYLTDGQFAARMARRLFDADVPQAAIRHYLTLGRWCPKPQEVEDQLLTTIDLFVSRHVERGTPRNRDTFQRMREAIDGLRNVRAKTSSNRSQEAADADQ